MTSSNLEIDDNPSCSSSKNEDNSGKSRVSPGNKLFVWLVPTTTSSSTSSASAPRGDGARSSGEERRGRRVIGRGVISCCFLFLRDNNNTDNDAGSPPQPKPSSRSNRSSRHNNNRRGHIRIEDIGLPYDFRHTSHLGPDSDLSNSAHVSTIVCNF